MDLTALLVDQLKGQAINQIAKKVWGGDSVMTSQLMAKALPMIMGQLEKNSQDPAQAEALDAALAKHDGSVLDNVEWADLDDGNKILSHIFGNKQEAVDQIAKETGASPEQSAGVMSMLAPLVMGAMWKEKKSAGLSASGITSMLAWSSKSSNMMGMFLDQDGDGDFDKKDAMKFGMNYLKKKFFGGR